MPIVLGGNQINKAYLGSAEIQKMYLGADLVFDNSAPPLSLTPIMTNFRVNEATPTHVHFDAPLGPVTGLTTQGFIVSDKTVLAIDTTLGYITIDSAFIFWDNNTIRLEGGNGVIYDFTMEHIENNIAEPLASTDRYVTTSGGTGAGTEGDPWSISYAIANASSGQTVWIKKGLYSYSGDSNLNVGNSGTTSAPIKFKGYDTVIGDLDDDYILDGFDYVSPANALTYVDPSKWPVIQGNAGAVESSSGIFTNQKNYLIFKNIQISYFQYDFWLYGSSFVHLENCTGAKGDNGSKGAGFRSGAINTVERLRLTKCLAFDGRIDNIWINGSHSAVLDCDTYSGISGEEKTDYNIVALPADNSIIKGCLSQAYVTAEGSDTHGIGIKQVDTVTSSRVSYLNLVVENTVNQDNGEALYIAHQGGTENVVKRNTVKGEPGHASVQGMRARGGAHNNIFENNYLEDITDCINFFDNTENSPNNSGYLAYDNTFRNNIINGGARVVNLGDGSGEALGLHGNLIYNNTFYNITDYMWIEGTTSPVYTANEFKNNIIYGDGNLTLYSGGITASAFDQQYNDYYNTGQATPSGTGNISVNPNFVDLVDFVPQADLLVQKILNYDWKGNERDAQSSMGGSIMLGESPAPDTKPPIYQSSSVEDSYPLTIDMVYDEALDDTSVPAISDFVVNDGTNNPVTNVSINGNEVKLILTNVIQGGETIILSYTKGANPIQDVKGNEAVDLTNENVTNNVNTDVLTDNLVAYWRWNNTYADQVGSYTGVGTGTSFVAGNSGQAVRVDGADASGVEIPSEPSFSFGNGTTDQPFSISMWLTFDVVAAGLREWVLAKRGGSGVLSEYQLGVYDGEIFLALFSQGGAIQIYKQFPIVGNFTAGQSHHLIITYDGSGTAAGMGMYLDNGSDLGTAFEDGSYVAMSPQATPLTVGDANYSDIFALTGNIDGLGLWDIELDAAQRTEIYDIQAAGNELL